MAGLVLVDEQRVEKPSHQFDTNSSIRIKGGDDPTTRYVGRGGLKLEAALREFQIDVSGRTCLDIGASTGGFTDCLLQHGAARVYAVDVTTSQLVWKLQRDPRVVPIETNARYLAAEAVPQRPSLVTADLSFISVTKVLPRLAELAESGADFLILVKPQFELERNDVGRGGIVREPALHQRAIERVRAAAVRDGFAVLGVQPSRLTGAEGNQEFFLHARRGVVSNSQAGSGTNSSSGPAALG